MRLKSLVIKNYKVLQDVTLDNIPRFMVVLGANGSGKSTLFDVFAFLYDALMGTVGKALQKRGGFDEVVSRGHTNETIQIELKFYIELTEKERLVTYFLEIGKGEDGRPRVAREILRYKRGSYGSPFHFLDFRNGYGYAITNEEDFDKTDEDLNREEQTLDTPDSLAIKGMGQFQRFKAARALRTLIERWHLSDFHISAARGTKDEGYAEHLSREGENLPLVAQYIYEHRQDIFDTILEKMKQRVPGVTNVEAKSVEGGRILLRFKDGAFTDPFSSRFVSDGTIKMFAYLILLYDPAPYPLLCVEEPENQLYHGLLENLADEFADYAERGGQVLVSTHSPEFLNAVALNSIFWLEKREGLSKIYRASDDENLVSLVRAGDKPGWLWAQGLFGGIGP